MHKNIHLFEINTLLVPKYDEVEEYVEVPVDENGNEIKDSRGRSGANSSGPSSQSGLPADPSSVRSKE